METETTTIKDKIKISPDLKDTTGILYYWRRLISEIKNPLEINNHWKNLEIYLEIPERDIVSPTIEYPSQKSVKEEITILPERLTNPKYGSVELTKHLRELAKKAPGLEEIWKITEKLPSLTDLIIEERENE